MEIFIPVVILKIPQKEAPLKADASDFTYLNFNYPNPQGVWIIEVALYLDVCAPQCLI